MNPPRVYAVALILVECVTLGVMSEVVAFVTVIGLIACVGATGKFSISLTRRRFEALLALIIVALVAKWFIAPPTIPWVSGHLTYNSGYAISQFLLLVQVVALFVSLPNPIMIGIPFLGAAVMAFAGNRISFGHDWHTTFFGTSAIVFTALIALYATSLANRGSSTKRRSHGPVLVAQCVILVLVIFLSLGSASLLVSSEDDLIRFASWLILDTPVTAPMGWSTSSSLGSLSILKSESATDTVLRVFSDHPPGYLKGKTYSHFQNDRWSSPTQERKTLEPIPARPNITTDKVTDSNLFQIEKSASGDQGLMEVWKDDSTGSTIFVPTNVSLLMVDIDVLYIDPIGNIESDKKTGASDYTVFVPKESEPVSDDDADYLDTPQDLDPEVADIVKTLFEGCKSSSEKIEKVKAFFREGFSYGLNVQIPPGEDSLTYFLTSNPPAHCEYFASGATILLRLGGVPARYVTGFVVQEKNSFGGYWVGTNEDAHAWVEAYDEERGWTLVETTPPEGLPSPGGMSQLDQFISYATYLISAIPGRIWRRVSGLLDTLSWSLVRRNTHFAIGFVLTVAIGFTFLIRRLRHRQRRATQIESDDPILVALQSARSKVDQLLKRKGWEKRPSETILQFAERIERSSESLDSIRGAAEWYREYCRVRYRPTRQMSNVEALNKRTVAL